MFSEKLIYHASPATKLDDTKTASNTCKSTDGWFDDAIIPISFNDSYIYPY